MVAFCALVSLVAYESGITGELAGRGLQLCDAAQRPHRAASLRSRAEGGFHVVVVGAPVRVLQLPRDAAHSGSLLFQCRGRLALKGLIPRHCTRAKELFRDVAPLDTLCVLLTSC